MEEEKDNLERKDMKLSWWEKLELKARFKWLRLKNWVSETYNKKE